jgi:5-methyltetrahydrofolate--homocysteine methyltransferase
MPSDLLSRLRAEILVSDGATGTMLMSRGLPSGGCPELMSRTDPDAVREIHRSYFAAGCDMVSANTFGGNRLRLRHYDLDGAVGELNRLGVKLAREVCPPGRYVLGSMGPTGSMLEPLGEVSRDEMQDLFSGQAEALAEAGVDGLLIETMMDVEEASIAVLAAKEMTGLPVLATMTFDPTSDGYRTMWGDTPEKMARRLAESGADVIGCNCVNGPAHAARIIGALRSATDLPLIAQPNAGRPEVVDSTPTYPMTPEIMEKEYRELVATGVKVVGGCCGSTPEHLARVVKLVRL